MRATVFRLNTSGSTAQLAFRNLSDAEGIDNQYFDEIGRANGDPQKQRLQFVVIALIAEERTAGTMGEVRAFGTPTIVHFCAALLVAAIISAPWHSLSGADLALSACGVAGVVYILTVIRHARRQSGYSPDAEDWFWYAGFPLMAYVTLAVAGALLSKHASDSLFVIAAVTLVLLFIGIHNAWDTVTYIAVRRWRERKESRQ